MIINQKNRIMDLLTPFLIGLFSSVHCLAMCGGLCGLFCRNNPGIGSIILINSGRILTYALLGVISAGVIHGLILRIPLAQIGFWIRTVLGFVLVYLGLRILLNKSSLHFFMDNNFLWKKAKQKLLILSADNRRLTQLLKGMLWGLIPCGLIYGVLIAAAATGNVFRGGLFMLAFGMGTLPSMLIAGGFMKTWNEKLQNKSIRFGAGFFVILVGIWSIISPWISDGLFPDSPVFTSVMAFLDSCVP